MKFKYFDFCYNYQIGFFFYNSFMEVIERRHHGSGISQDDCQGGIIKMKGFQRRLNGLREECVMVGWLAGLSSKARGTAVSITSSIQR